MGFRYSEMVRGSIYSKAIVIQYDDDCLTAAFVPFKIRTKVSGINQAFAVFHRHFGKGKTWKLIKRAWQWQIENDYPGSRKKLRQAGYYPPDT